MGIIALTMTAVVMAIGRSRERPPSRAASSAAAPSWRCRSAKVQSKIEFATETPTAIIAPMKDWRLSVDPVKRSASPTPASTAGRGMTTASATRTDWKDATMSVFAQNW